MRTRLCAILLIVAILLSVTACGNEPVSSETTQPSGSTTGITSLDFFYAVEDGIELEVGEEEKSYFTIEGTKDFSLDDIVFVSSDESVCTFVYDKTALTTYIYFVVTAVGPGTATIHTETADGLVKSAEITVTVTGEISAADEISPVAEQMAESYKIEEGNFDDLNRREIRVTISPELEAEASDEDIADFLNWLVAKQDDAFDFSKLYIYLFATGDDWSGGFTIAMCEYTPGEEPVISIHTPAEREAFRQ